MLAGASEIVQVFSLAKINRASRDRKNFDDDNSTPLTPLSQKLKIIKMQIHSKIHSRNKYLIILWKNFSRWC